MENILELSNILNSYMEQRVHLSLNSLAQNMKVAETSLRRIRKSELKRMPKNDTTLKILSYIFKTSDLYILRSNLRPDGLGKYLTDEFLLSDSTQKLDIRLIDNAVSDQTSYLVFKLASNSIGTTVGEVERLFGMLGTKAIDSLALEDLIEVCDGRITSKVSTFKVSNKYFIRNFKAISDFIKVDSGGEAPNLFYNLSESVNQEAASKIHKVQKKALKEISAILNNDESRGEIPLFILSAVDTLS